MTTNELESYLRKGVQHIIKSILASSLKNPKASVFMTKYILQKKSQKKDQKPTSEHIPPFLIASITNQCNLHCAGCYARANNSCEDLSEKATSVSDSAVCTGQGGKKLLSADDWNRIFSEAEELSIDFILLAGGEPFVRKDVLLQAGLHESILFPIFTNGTMMTKDAVTLLCRYRNLLPVLSIEGNEETTDLRRGFGVYQKLQDTMKLLSKNGILFGASITVTTKNLSEVFHEAFVRGLAKNGVKAFIYVEYVPVDGATKELAPEEEARTVMEQKLSALRTLFPELLFVAFPGDEKAAGGCLAAGRGFFHINAYGGAEPCPFSPYSDTSLTKVSLREALHSPLFQAIRSTDSLTKEHTGGCVLFSEKEKVETLLLSGGKAHEL